MQYLITRPTLITALIMKIFSHIYGASVTAIVLFFLIFTFSAVFGLLPEGMQASLQPQYIELKSAHDMPTTVPSPNVSLVTSAPDIAHASVASALSTPTQSLLGEVPPLVYTPQGIKEAPQKIVFPRLGKEVAVYNPESYAIGTLDSYLLKGAVRYPGSAMLGEVGNVFIFGHSSYAKIVRSQAYKTFTDIQKLKREDEIHVVGKEHTYVYQVRNVIAVSDAAAVSLDQTGQTLTLSTCNVLGRKEDRFLLTADFVRSYANPVANVE